MSDRKTKDKFTDAADRLAWEVMLVSACLEKLRTKWAKMIGISGPQWMILTVIANAQDHYVGLPVGAVSRALRVDQSFVVTQSKALEKKGLLCRKISSDDARVVNLSLTEQAAKQIATLDPRRKELDEFIYNDFSLAQLNQLSHEMRAIKERLEKAIVKLTADL